MRHSLQKYTARLLALAMALALILCCVPTARAAEASGSCGSGVAWKLEGGVLTLSGNGVMNDYAEFTPAPWKNHSDSVKAVVVEEGVKNIGNFAFFMLEKITSVTLADSVKTIGGWAFYGCSGLQLLDMGSGVQEIGRSAFERCYAMTGVRLPKGLQTLRYHAFYLCESLVSITVPASVTTFESAVFSRCTGLRNAKILASITKLPALTFDGCEALVSVSLTPEITEVGVNAYYDCEKLEEPTHDAKEGNVTVSTSSKVETENGTVTTQNRYTETESSTITSQTVITEKAGEKNAQVQVDAVLDSAQGWSDLNQAIILPSGGADQVQVDVHLKGEPVVSGEDISRFADQDIKLSIHTSQGAVWHIQTELLADSQLTEAYDLSFTIRPVTKLNKGQAEAVGNATCFGVTFNKTLDFKVEVELPLGKDLARQTAAFYAPIDGKVTQLQAVMIDKTGVAHFYLGYVEKDFEYLIAINPPQQPGVSTEFPNIIIPDQMKDEFPGLVNMQDIDYIITGRKSSWGVEVNQVTWMIVGLLVGSAVVVGVVMFAINKARLKAGYIPPMDDEEEEE